MLIWPLTVSPILTVLIYYFHMYRTLTYSKFFRSLPYCCLFFNNIIGYFNCPFFNIFFQG
nr:MAG TPA: hypothetical protein [Caudoviricetes sp.]